ncbi:uncharacterized protein LOC143023139 [Oratosquilla oratoria]|uniref:uncharacterized protein LOC143023139 n=1 Tax=Oratosquilla oratoria TaxID=337810 RepID=UPI003F761F50
MEGPYPIYYLPHRPVIKECVSSKIRPVFDASAVGSNGVSLNDCLESGPSLIPDLVEILLRFRRWKIGLTADITKAFLQIRVQRSDQDVHRFLWQCGQSLRVMRFVTVPFGNTSSPFLLNATIRHHLNSYPVSVTVQELQENLYVDDWLSGADTVEEANTMFLEAQSILSDAGMTLSKWNSNSKSLTHQLNQFFEVGETTKLLGMHWKASKDVFSFKGLNLDCNFDLNFTKRNLLSLIARLFDPLGLISPYTMYAKILFQEIWRLGLGWDEILSHDLQLKCQLWIDGIQSIKTFEIHRCYYPDSSLSSLVGLEVHAFSDASEKGYGSCVYLRIPKSDKEFHVSFVMARTKVAPIKRVTLPRLELLGALLSAHLSHFVKSALRLNNCVRLVCWTDSKVALSWIKGNPNRWKMFVANGVNEIQTLTSPSNWFHCPGKGNPADLMTRGLLADQLISNNMWLGGPNWLSSSSCFHAGANIDDETHILAHTCKESKGEETALTVNEKATSVFDFSRYSEFSKVMNIVAWVKRFINNCKPDGTKHSGPLTYEELIKAKDNILVCVQKESYENERNALSQGKPIPRISSLIRYDPFLDSNGLLRVKGRLQYSDLSYDSKHPIIIPNCHVAKLIVQFQHNLLKHAGVHTLMSTIRNSYWIIGLRQVAKRVCRECVACKRFDSRPCSQSPPPLPELRIKSTFPFAITGLDYAGPLFAVDQLYQKLYFLLFTCAVTRSVHLELTDSLSVPDCLLALRRFSARRGLPSVVYSDNAKTFKSVAKALQQYFSVLSPEWKFIAPRSPWWGGWWERLVRSVKSALKKCLGTRCLTKCELETTLFEVEACINSRPLTYVSDDYDAKNPLTPSHFLIGRVAGFQPHISDEHLGVVSHKDLNEREHVRERDGIVRCVNVKTAKGIFCRPVQKLHDLESCFETNSVKEDIANPLECSMPDEKDVARDEDVESLEKVKTTRSGRVVKPRVLLDFKSQITYMLLKLIYTHTSHMDIEKQ